ncbi:MAG: hypothetical protein JW829_21355 [Pirellulales bacterium]|nr:hypothetical protein [Pirellulales bacterium]
MTALTARHDVLMALTAGWDSRVLLAASKHVSRNIKYFVYRQTNVKKSHSDIWVPKKIAGALGIDFAVKRPFNNQLPGWFVSMLSQNVTCARVLPKTINIYDKLIAGNMRININGNASEICRNFYDKYCKMNVSNISSADLAVCMFGDKAPSFVIKELDEWKNGFDYQTNECLNLLDFLYWEQRLGNWGAQYPAEQDIAVEEISPFNCRLLIETLLSSPRHLRAAPDYPLYRELIRHMWPEALAFPINPHSKGMFVDILKRQVRYYSPSSAIRRLKRLLK